jgi:hypothetical protein
MPGGPGLYVFIGRCRLIGRCRQAALLSLVLGALIPGRLLAEDAAAGPSDAAEFFEKEIRPVLVERCQKCHGPEKQWAGLRLDSRAGLLKGGDGGPAVVPNQAGESELLRRVTESDESLRMPPAKGGGPLTERQVEAIRYWISAGAVWPESADAAAGPLNSQAEHWAFQPVQKPVPPDVRDTNRAETPIDRFVLRRLGAEGLNLSPPADRATLIRRATYDLTGLPPTAAEVEAFVTDERPDAYERLIDRLLASPAYGEHWGRHWLDVARYSDTKGYVYGREERFFVHAAAYRDWVVRAFNEDLPYDRFLRLQIAADQAAPDDPSAAAAMGFLTLGRRFLGVTPDIIDDRIDVVCRGLMGLTVGCARCHDHKFDPIPTADYYSLYGVFEDCSERIVPLPSPGAPAASPDFLKGLEERGRKLRETTAARSAEASERVRQRIGDYLFAQRDLGKYPPLGFDQVLSKDELIPTIVHRWRKYLLDAEDRRDPVFRPWLAFMELGDEEFAAKSEAVTRELRSDPAINAKVAKAFAEPPASPREVADRYAQLFAEVDRGWRELCAAANHENRPPPDALADPDAEALRQVLYGTASPCVIPDEPIVNTESLYDTATINELWALQVELDRWLKQAPEASPHAVILTDRDSSTEPRIYRRGNPANPGDAVPRRFLELIAGADRKPFTKGSGRLELAEAIVDSRNPLTARVWVNRVWMHHFGAGLVRTPSDFGLRAEPPSHPELLDWLAAELVESGWDTKALHRLIMRSAAYRQASSISDWGLRIADSAGSNPQSQTANPQSLDPENRLLWRMNAHRLGFEEMRDTLLAASGELDRRIGGRAVELFPSAGVPLRRTVYGLVDRQFVPGVMRVFDFANPDLHSPQRSETSVPQQALFALNSPFVADRATSIAARLGDGPPSDRVARLYGAVLRRDPTPPQRRSALAFVEMAEAGAAHEAGPSGAAAWSYGYGELDEPAGRLKEFHPLPYFGGSAWQGGPRYPDAALGWVQLSAQGGHPGNDLRHAAVRRWTAPRDGTVAVRSVVAHEVAAGDGVRCRIVSSRRGVLAAAVVHNTRQPLNVESVEVRAGDTLDFVADIKDVLNSDQHLWAPEIRYTDAAGPASESWNAERDFAGPKPVALGPWEQLAQVLLMSNEFMFVD